MTGYTGNVTWNETQTIRLHQGDPVFRRSTAVMVHIYFLWMAICAIGMLLIEQSMV